MAFSSLRNLFPFSLCLQCYCVSRPAVPMAAVQLASYCSRRDAMWCYRCSVQLWPRVGQRIWTSIPSHGLAVLLTALVYEAYCHQQQTHVLSSGVQLMFELQW